MKRRTTEEAQVELLTSAEVAALLRVHPKQIYRLLARGLPAKRVGNGWRFVREDVLAWSARAPTSSSRSTPAPSPTKALVEPPPLLAANGDVVIDLLLAEVGARGGPLVGLVQSDRSTALGWLAERKVVAAGHHGAPMPSHLADARLARLHVVEREVGVASRARLRGVRDLAKLRLATRPATAGVRAHLDRALADAGLGARTLRGSVTCASHREAVLAVLRGEADAALTTSAWAERAGLGFLPIADESYDLVLFADALGSAAVVAISEALQSRDLRRAIGRVAGYDARRTGDIRYDPPR